MWGSRVEGQPLAPLHGVPPTFNRGLPKSRAREAEGKAGLRPGPGRTDLFRGRTPGGHAERLTLEEHTDGPQAAPPTTRVETCARCPLERGPLQSSLPLRQRARPPAASLHRPHPARAVLTPQGQRHLRQTPGGSRVGTQLLLTMRHLSDITTGAGDTSSGLG